MLVEAGLSDDLKTKILFRDRFRGYPPEPVVIAVEFQSQSRDNLGIEAEVVVLESGRGLQLSPHSFGGSIEFRPSSHDRWAL